MQNKQFWAIIPAAGVGKRMLADRPKQYLKLQDKTVIEHTLDKLLNMQEVTGVVLSISDTDEYWPDLNYQSKKPLLVASGGQERSDSVLNALTLLNHQNSETENTWVLVHDAARPCVRGEDIQNLIRLASQKDDGGLLALPVRDTMKRAQHAKHDQPNNVNETVDRDGLWHALTPQMFKLDLLLNALTEAQKNKSSITDDASAMELMGYQPTLVEAHEDNIKITRAFDLQLAALFLKNQS
ncbi:MAG: 2-C-methyl-D-erythritol 4-phosphate cytidylyltransferase [Gammaproteobacteria bacterium]|nr:2-C-methyl-D-erythritol 4-phosphate cytidylyltransferase [Gammaproteobacteria bacterium]